MTLAGPHAERPAFIVTDARLQQVFTRTPERCASVEEYARAAGMDVSETLALLTPLLEHGVLALDSVGGQLMVNTAPNGRPAPFELPQARANLWEQLRDRANLERAFGLWQLIRGLEAGGWNVTTDRERLEAHVRVPRHLLQMGVTVRHPRIPGEVIVPLVPYPPANELPGLCETFHADGATGLAVTCQNRALDAAVTGCRSWFLANPGTSLTVFVLEAPAFGATVVRPDDNSVTPVVVQRYQP